MCIYMNLKNTSLTFAILINDLKIYFLSQIGLFRSGEFHPVATKLIYCFE